MQTIQFSHAEKILSRHLFQSDSTSKTWPTTGVYRADCFRLFQGRHLYWPAGQEEEVPEQKEEPDHRLVAAQELPLQEVQAGRIRLRGTTTRFYPFWSGFASFSRERVRMATAAATPTRRSRRVMRRLNEC